MKRENAKAKFTTINKDAIPLFSLIAQIAIAPIFHQCRYLARFIPRNPAPSSRKDYCKPLASCASLIENNIFR